MADSSQATAPPSPSFPAIPSSSTIPSAALEEQDPAPAALASPPVYRTVVGERLKEISEELDYELSRSVQAMAVAGKASAARMRASIARMEAEALKLRQLLPNVRQSR
jgi:hypothetical protein